MATGTLVALGGEVDLGQDNPVPMDQANDRAVSAAGGAVSLTFTADAERGITIAQIHCGYDAAPAAGSTLTIEDGSGTIFWRQPITAAGPHEFNFSPPRTGRKNTALVVTLTAGGGAVLAYLNVAAFRVK